MLACFGRIELKNKDKLNINGGEAIEVVKFIAKCTTAFHSMYKYRTKYSQDRGVNHVNHCPLWESVTEMSRYQFAIAKLIVRVTYLMT